MVKTSVFHYIVARVLNMRAQSPWGVSKKVKKTEEIPVPFQTLWVWVLVSPRKLSWEVQVPIIDSIMKRRQIEQRRELSRSPEHGERLCRH